MLKKRAFFIIVSITLIFGNISPQSYNRIYHENNPPVYKHCKETCVLGNKYWRMYNLETSEKTYAWPRNTDIHTEYTRFFGYNKTWYDILTSPFKNDLCVYAGREYITTQLNKLNGVCETDIGSHALNLIENILENRCVDQGGIRRQTMTHKEKRSVTIITELTKLLYEYNTGKSQNSHCLLCTEPTTDFEFEWIDDFYNISEYHRPNCRVNPQIDCNMKNEDSCVAFFGYKNLEESTIYIPQGSSNDRIYNSITDSANHPIANEMKFFIVGDIHSVFSSERNCTESPVQTWNLSKYKSTSLPSNLCPRTQIFESDCNGNGVSDLCEINFSRHKFECNENYIDPRCILKIGVDICNVLRHSQVKDDDMDGIPDLCQRI